MDTVYPTINSEKDSTIRLLSVINFVKTFPTDIPVYITCTYPNHGDVRMLLIPQYYQTGFFRCEILAVDAPLLPKGYRPTNGDWDKIDIDIQKIKCWKPWKHEDAFLNFGNGYITDRYLKMLFN